MGDREVKQYKSWTHGEKQKLVNLIKHNFSGGSINWIQIAEHMIGRTPQQCKSTYQTITSKLKKQQGQKQDKVHVEYQFKAIDQYKNVDDKQEESSKISLSEFSMHSESKEFEPLTNPGLPPFMGVFDDSYNFDPEFKDLTRYQKFKIFVYGQYYKEDFQQLSKEIFIEYSAEQLNRFYKYEYVFYQTLMKLCNDTDSQTPQQLVQNYTQDQLLFFFNDLNMLKFKIDAYKAADTSNTPQINIVLPRFCTKFPIFDGLLSYPSDPVEKDFFFKLNKTFDFTKLTMKMEYNEFFQSQMLIDMHSTCSDGQHNPVKLVQMALEVKLDVISITDHDTLQSFFYLLDNIQQLQELFDKYKRNMTIIAGCELSVNADSDDKTHHLCTYFPKCKLQLNDLKQPEKNQLFVQFKHFATNLDEMRANRIQRSKKYFDKLVEVYGFNLDFDEFCKINKINIRNNTSENVIGRPHIAKYLLDKGYIQSIKQAFNEYLSDQSPAYQQLPKVYISQRLQEVKHLMAVTILAHPFIWKYDENTVVEHICQAYLHGLNGFELYHSSQCIIPKTLQMKIMEKTQRKLVVSIASDFHVDSGNINKQLGNLPMNCLMTQEEKTTLLKILL